MLFLGLNTGALSLLQSRIIQAFNKIDIFFIDDVSLDFHGGCEVIFFDR